MSSISTNELAEEVMKALNEYKDVTEKDFEEIAKAVAREGTKKLKATSPKGKGSRKGHYADGWGVSYSRKGNGKFQFVVHNKKKPGLTHLLEKGHALNRGGRARAFVHIKPVEEWCNAEYERRVEAELRK